jgi:hypothetical protein
MRAWKLAIPLLTLAALMMASSVRADSTLELWANFMAEWQASQRLQLTFNLEPRVLLVGAGQWETINFTTSAEVETWRWLDLLAELKTGYTADSEEPNTFELTERIGVHVFFIRSRFQLADMLRLEQRNRFYTDSTDDHLLRTRNRIEASYVINRERASQPGAVIGLADFELFVPVKRDAHERYASRYRIRAGVGYRCDADWRVDLIYMFQKSRNTYGAPFSNAENIVDIRLRRAF